MNPYFTAATIFLLGGVLLWCSAPVASFLYLADEMPEVAEFLSDIGLLVIITGLFVGAAGAFRKQ